jgi:hypothetical protein
LDEQLELRRELEEVLAHKDDRRDMPAPGFAIAGASKESATQPYR